jgi:GTP pyrophosphokinase
MKDYIASPKPNGYQSLHTTIFAGDGSMAEIQIRTQQMHHVAEFGAASHVRYKTDTEGGQKRKLAWFDEIMNTVHSSKKTSDTGNNVPKWIKEMAIEQAEATDPEEFMKNLETDFFEDRIFVFSPNGDVVDLPVESTPIDFVSGARINQKFSSLDTKLQNGDVVEIITNDTNHPKHKWLDYAKTILARGKIKRYLKQEALEN